MLDARPSVVQHLVSSRSLTRGQLHALFAMATEMRATSSSDLAAVLNGRVLAVLFFQPSTRTRLGFEASALRLGAGVIGFSDLTTTRSVDYCGESLEDTVRVVAELANGIVIRHYLSGAARRAASVSRVPVVNGGDGSNEHPTQAISDAWLMHRRLGDVRGATVGLVGDPGTRVLRSLALTLIALGASKLLYQVPDSLPLVTAGGSGVVHATLPADLRAALDKAGIAYEFRSDVCDILTEADALEILPVNIAALEAIPTSLSKNPYVTPERFRITRQKLLATKSRTLVFHPGPRADELDPDTDDNPNSMYFEQVREAQFVRMAILSNLLASPVQNEIASLEGATANG